MTVKIIQILSWIAGLFLLISISFIIWASITDFKPLLRMELSPKGNANQPFPESRELNLLSWNIGYCGLGKEMDFFYDGGKQTRCSIEQYQQYLNGIFNFLSSQSHLDFCLIQEVDVDSKRSYYTQQEQMLIKAFSKLNSVYAENYNVGFVPVPLQSPMGKVSAGMMTFSPYKIGESYRLGFEVNYDWPKRLFMLDRCLLVTRLQLENGKSLVIVNLHNSAFDDDGRLRQGELRTLKTLLLDEYSKGNYVIAGGDWNQNPPGFKKSNFTTGDAAELISPPFSKDFMPSSWKWMFDAKSPSNRFLNEAYQKGKTLTTIIDYFIVSPNIEALSVKTFPLGFEFSDHNPVMISVKLSDEPWQRQIQQDTLKIHQLQDSIQVLLHKKTGRKPVGK